MKALRSMPRPARLSKSSMAAGLFAFVAQIDFAVHEQCQALLEAHGVDVGLAHLLLQGVGNSVQLQCAQLIDGVVLEHGGFPWEVGDHW
jgi:hypothetical protein